MLTPEQKEIACSVANSLGFDAPPQLLEFAERFLAALKQQEPVGYLRMTPTAAVFMPFVPVPDGTKFYTAPATDYKPIAERLLGALVEVRSDLTTIEGAHSTDRLICKEAGDLCDEIIAAAKAAGLGEE